MSNWNVLHTAPKSERKLTQRLNATGYVAFCPMQIVFRRWKGQTKEVFIPLFPGCLFVEESSAEIASFASAQGATLLMNREGKALSIQAEDKAELSSKFMQILSK